MLGGTSGGGSKRHRCGDCRSRIEGEVLPGPDSPISRTAFFVPHEEDRRMAGKGREVASCKLSRSEKRLLQAMAEAEGSNVNRLLKSMVRSRIQETYNVSTTG
jgi:hypothetical protein